MRAGSGYGAISALRMGMNSMVSPSPTSKCTMAPTDVAAGGIEFDAGERGHEFHLREAAGTRFLLAVLEQQSSDAAAGAGGIDKEGANLGGLGARVECR